MTPDPIDRLSARLFESARGEALPRGAEQRALQAIRREIGHQPLKNARASATRPWLLAAACVALAAAAAILLRPKNSEPGISAEPSIVARARPEPRSTPSAAPSEVAPIAPSLAVMPKPMPSVTPAPVHSAPASLSDELSALKVASSALSAGDAKAALAALDRYDRVLKGQKLRAEATLLRLEALSQAGQAQAASALARRFVEQNPGSPLVDRARTFIRE
ncbi:MAG TPA: hypothetical protein VFK05_38080 [Polyangiaceae bacterium]|nr:hypothetical protein [Polyangiaceae bacterium]